MSKNKSDVSALNVQREIDLLKQTLRYFHDNNLSFSELITRANEAFIVVSQTKNKKIIDIVLGVADLETDLRTDPVLAGERLKDAYTYFEIR